METKTDIEAEIAKQIRLIQSYNWKLNNRVGTPETAEANIRKALEVIETLLQEGAISAELGKKVKKYQSKFNHLTTISCFG